MFVWANHYEAYLYVIKRLRLEGNGHLIKDHCIIITENKVCCIDDLYQCFFRQCSETAEKLAVPNKEYVVYSIRPPPNKKSRRLWAEGTY